MDKNSFVVGELADEAVDRAVCVWEKSCGKCSVHMVVDRVCVCMEFCGPNLWTTLTTCRYVLWSKCTATNTESRWTESKRVAKSGFA